MIRLNRPPCPHPQALANGNYKHPTNKQALASAASGKCMYCEAAISHVNFGHIEHIKPKESFSELTFVWDNLGYACDRCNNSKGSKYFPRTPLLDPYSEDPAGHLLAYGPFVFCRDGSERGELTINEIDLNRAQLVELRANRITALQKALVAASRAGDPAVKESAIAQLKSEAQSDKEFSLVASALMAALIT